MDPRDGGDCPTRNDGNHSDRVRLEGVIRELCFSGMEKILSWVAVGKNYWMSLMRDSYGV